MGNFDPSKAISLIFGSGMARALEFVDVLGEITYADIPHFSLPSGQVKGHDYKLCWGMMAGVPVVVQCGRLHVYQFELGDSCVAHKVAFLPRLVAMLGVRDFVVASAVGSLQRDLRPGHFVVLTSIDRNEAPDPTRGSRAVGLGEQFTAMARIFDKDLVRIAESVANGLEGLSLSSGDLAFVTGPSFETAAETRRLAVRCKAAGMSGPVTATALAHMKGLAAYKDLRCLFLGGVTDMCPGVDPDSDHHEAGHDEVLATMDPMITPLRRLLTGIVGEIARSSRA
jgi:purine nucleoside phosphorylase